MVLLWDRGQKPQEEAGGQGAMYFGRAQVFSECQRPAVTSLPGQAAAYAGSARIMTIQGNLLRQMLLLMPVLSSQSRNTQSCVLAALRWTAPLFLGCPLLQDITPPPCLFPLPHELGISCAWQGTAITCG